ncbi:nucleoside-diphosphate sugar epimerase/dehydratase [Halomonas sp. CS7]|uniref:Nucleoside-diphosphate sugar epimerase/dehydratase n=1 Tax=Halomonas pelophila TaxID=3151122 RepID=A0ABV1N8J1_9GAMM
MSWILQRALRLSRRQKCFIQLILDAPLLSASLLLAIILKQESMAPLLDPHITMTLLITLPITLAIFFWLGLYRILIRYVGVKMLHTLAAGVMASSLVIWTTSALLGSSLHASTLAIYSILAMCSVGGIRFFSRSLFHRNSMRHKARVIIYGAGTAGSQLVSSLRKGSEFIPIAFVDDWKGMHGTIVEGIKVYSPDFLNHLISTMKVERILLAMPSISRSRRQEIIASLENMNVTIQTIPGMEEIVNGDAKPGQIRDVAVEDLLGRDPVPPRLDLLDANIRDKVVMVTGAGGSIGSELSRQIMRLGPKKLLLLDTCEYALYTIEKELEEIQIHEKRPTISIALIGSVQEEKRINSIMKAYRVQTLYHAAAYKHVPMVEYNLIEGIKNNVFGTLSTARAAIAAEVENFILVSTDKAVRPTNMMGATKRLAELICQAFANSQDKTRFCMVRFGNVLGSSGSVIPLFRRQIAQGGPLTVTHESITRYFMTIPEAASLVLQAGAMGKGGDVFVLDMGEPVKISALASRMIRLSGLEIKSKENPYGDIEIIYSGLRPGEKLFEELLIGKNATGTDHPRIHSAREPYWKWPKLKIFMDNLQEAINSQDIKTLHNLILQSPAGFCPQTPIVDKLWCIGREVSEMPATHSADFAEKNNSDAPLQHMKTNILMKNYNNCPLDS